MTPEKLSGDGAWAAGCGAGVAGAGCVPPALGVAFCAASGAASQSAASARHRRTTIMNGGMVGGQVDEAAAPHGAHHGRARCVSNLPAPGHEGNVELFRSCNGPNLLLTTAAAHEGAVTRPLHAPH